MLAVKLWTYIIHLFLGFCATNTYTTLAYANKFNKHNCVCDAAVANLAAMFGKTIKSIRNASIYLLNHID